MNNLYHLEAYEPDDPDKTVIWKGEIIDKFTTEYCDIIRLRTQLYGDMIFMDNCIQSASVDEHIYHETLVHPLAEYVENIDRVLILGGGEGCTAREVLKYDPDFILQIDIDHQFVNWCSNVLQWDEGALKNNKVHLIYDDAWAIIKKGPYKLYNYIIVDLFDPDSETVDKFCELLVDCSKWLNENGILVAYAGMLHTLNPAINKILPYIEEHIGEYCSVIDWYTTYVPSFGGECVFVFYCLEKKPGSEEDNKSHLVIDVGQ
jgi:spermidine synthase